jgi:cytochrome c-type biogenesis protein CcmF
MMPELGQVALILALCLSLILGVFPMIGAWRGNRALMALSTPAAAGQFVFVAFAFALLTYAFISQDFSVEYVANNSNSELPLIYRYTAVWGGHEGSKLLWALVLASWTLAVTAFSRHLPETLRARVLGTLGLIGSGFLGFLVFTSNPFLRFLPPARDGNDLNPLLQDPGMIIHPPMLYMGYVGMAVPFAFAVAALLEGKIDRQWVRWSRPWTNIAWAFLTVGIALGSWWAYYELGWGGWWFWDPVENASFMPWLVAAALIHAQAITEKRGTFVNWTLLLSIAGFSLSLLGTFLVRSGILTSVHAFASDPKRGAYILTFLGLVSGGALTLFVLRGATVRVKSEASLISKESLLLVNNVLLVSACFLVLCGTLWPLVCEVMKWPKVSVGAPWFGINFALIVAPLLALMPLGAFTRWNGDSMAQITAKFRWVFALALAASALTFLRYHSELPAPALDTQLKLSAVIKPYAGVFLGFWILVGTLAFLFKRFAEKPAGQRYTLEMLAMSSAHFGVGLWLLGVIAVETLSVERDVRLSPGESVAVGNYSVTMKRVAHVSGPNYEADQGEFELKSGDAVIATLLPQKRQYRRGAVQTEAAIDPSLTRDIYIALGEPLDSATNAWAVRVYHKPFIRLIWLGALFMGFGGLLGALERRLRKPVTSPAQALSPLVAQ